MPSGSFRVYSGTDDIERLLAAYGCTAVQPGSDRFRRSSRISPGLDVRPQQDSNLRSRLRRAIPFRSLTSSNVYDLAILGRCGGASAGVCVLHPGHQRGLPRRSATRLWLLALVPVQELDDLLAHPVKVRAKLDKDLGGNAVTLPDQAKQDVLGTDVVVTELQRLA